MLFSVLFSLLFSDQNGFQLNQSCTSDTRCSKKCLNRETSKKARKESNELKQQNKQISKQKNILVCEYSRFMEQTRDHCTSQGTDGYRPFFGGSHHYSAGAIHWFGLMLVEQYSPRRFAARQIFNTIHLPLLNVAQFFLFPSAPPSTRFFLPLPAPIAPGFSPP